MESAKRWWITSSRASHLYVPLKSVSTTERRWRSTSLSHSSCFLTRPILMTTCATTTHSGANSTSPRQQVARLKIAINLGTFCTAESANTHRKKTARAPDALIWITGTGKRRTNLVQMRVIVKADSSRVIQRVIIVILMLSLQVLHFNFVLIISCEQARSESAFITKPRFLLL